MRFIIYTNNNLSTCCISKCDNALYIFFTFLRNLNLNSILEVSPVLISSANISHLPKLKEYSFILYHSVNKHNSLLIMIYFLNSNCVSLVAQFQNPPISLQLFTTNRLTTCKPIDSRILTSFAIFSLSQIAANQSLIQSFI